MSNIACTDIIITAQTRSDSTSKQTRGVGYFSKEHLGCLKLNFLKIKCILQQLWAFSQ